MARLLRDRQQFEFPVGHGLSFQARLQDKPTARLPMLYTTSVEQRRYWSKWQVIQRACLWQDYYGIGNGLSSPSTRQSATGDLGGKWDLKRGHGQTSTKPRFDTISAERLQLHNAPADD